VTGDKSSKRRKLVGRYRADTEVRGIDLAATAARWLTVYWSHDLGQRGNSRQLGQLGRGLDRVHQGVVAVGLDEARKRVIGATPGCRCREYEPTNEANEDRENEPRPPSASQLGAKHQPDRSQKCLPLLRVNMSVAHRVELPKGVSLSLMTRATTTSDGSRIEHLCQLQLRRRSRAVQRRATVEPLERRGDAYRRSATFGPSTRAHRVPSSASEVFLSRLAGYWVGGISKEADRAATHDGRPISVVVSNDSLLVLCHHVGAHEAVVGPEEELRLADY